MELYQLKAFVQVTRIGNLTQAAERLHISPSALSTQIRNLEADLEIPLYPTAQGLIREGQGLALMRSDDAQRLVAEGCASIWSRGMVRVPLGLAGLAQNGNDPILRAARGTILGLWGRRTAFRW
jgi:DNA-binding transcriptional LysR family regulator